MPDSDYVFEEGDPIAVGSHGQDDFLFHQGDPVPNTGESDLVFEAGVGVGGLERLEDWEDPFTFSRYGGSLTYAERVTSPVWEGEHAGRIGGEPNGNDVGIHTTDVTLEVPITLTCRFRVEVDAAAVISFLAQGDGNSPETYQVSAEASDSTFEVEYNNGGGFGGDSDNTSRQDENVSYSTNEWYVTEFGVLEDDDNWGIYYRDGGNQTAIAGDTSPSPPSQEWLDIHVDWQSNGDITVEIYREDGTFFDSLSANHTRFDTPGFGARGDCIIDYARVL